jgi:hypothetical protein
MTTNRLKFFSITMKVLNYFNVRTFLAVIISQVAAFVAIRYDIKFNLNLILFGLAVGFPLNFSIQAAFKRREKALEAFSKFKAGLMALYYSIQSAEDLQAEKKTNGTSLLKASSDQLALQLETKQSAYEFMQHKLNDIFTFMQTNRDELSKRSIVKMIRYLASVQESSVFLISLTTHRTMAGLRFYTLFFVLIFPLVQVPILLQRLDGVVPHWMIYIFVGITTLILVSLHNFQKMIEYPFDQRGMDNIRIGEFKLDV